MIMFTEFLLEFCLLQVLIATSKKKTILAVICGYFLRDLEQYQDQEQNNKEQLQEQRKNPKG